MWGLHAPPGKKCPSRDKKHLDGNSQPIRQKNAPRQGTHTLAGTKAPTSGKKRPGRVHITLAGKTKAPKSGKKRPNRVHTSRLSYPRLGRPGSVHITLAGTKRAQVGITTYLGQKKSPRQGTHTSR